MREAIENLVTLFEHGTLSRGQLIQGLRAAVAQLSTAANAGAESTPGKSTFGVDLSIMSPRASPMSRDQRRSTRECWEEPFLGNPPKVRRWRVQTLRCQTVLSACTNSASPRFIIFASG